MTKLKGLNTPVWVLCDRFTADGTRLLNSSPSNLGGNADRKVPVWDVPDGP